MAAIEPFSESVIESLSKVLGECGTGSEVSGILKRCGIPDSSVESTKWRRLNSIFSTIQREDACANRVVAFLQAMMEPARWIGRVDDFTARRIEVNTVLAFCGLALEEDGKLRQVGAATTLTDAEARARTLRAITGATHSRGGLQILPGGIAPRKLFPRRLRGCEGPGTEGS